LIRVNRLFAILFRKALKAAGTLVECGRSGPYFKGICRSAAPARPDLPGHLRLNQILSSRG
jgi:hypothetical protein